MILNERLTEVLARHYPSFNRLVSCDRLSGGASQETYRIVIDTAKGEKQLAMRRAPGGVTPESDAMLRPGLATEALLMQTARAAGVPEPEVHFVLEPADGLGEGFIMQWLEGEALGARIVRSAEFDQIRPKLARLCGETLARLHAIDIKASGIDQHLKVKSAWDFVMETWDRYKALDTAQPMIDFAARWLIDHLPDEVEPQLVHNDFRNGNIMLSPTDGIVAVLDWEVAYLGDPMRDLGWICTNSWRFGKTELPVGGFGSYDEFFEGYESVSGTRVDRECVKFWEVFGSFWWAVGCLTMVDRYRNGSDKTVERPAIGRRSSECQVDCVNLLIPGDVELVSTADEQQNLDMPRVDELLLSVRNFLHEQVMADTQGRLNFLARVAGNSLDIVERELRLGPRCKANELQRLQTLVNSSDNLPALRLQLVQGLRDGSIALDAPGLAAHLRATVVNQLAIDQPRYSGLSTALGGVPGLGR